MADIINFYDELLAGDREATLAEINSRLKELKLQLSSKVQRPSSHKDEWMRQLDLIEQAFIVFDDEDSRDRYDLELKRAGTPTDAETRAIDWTSRAWNYYFIGDNGAALVASRKAKEQSPKSAMPFVVSAWVQLKDNEWKQAKQEADEAFVLDDQVEDSVDVQMVRGTAYLFMGTREHKKDPAADFDRALASFQKVLPKAAPAEQAELHWRLGLTYDAMKNDAAAFDEGLQGLSVQAEISPIMRHNLELTTSSAINSLCNIGNDARKAISLYESKKTVISQSAMSDSSKQSITSNIDENLKRLKKLDDLWTRRKRAESVQMPTGGQPGFPLFVLVAAIVAFLIMIGAFSSGGAGAGAFFLLATIGLVVFLVVRINAANQYKAEMEAFKSAQAELDKIAHQLDVKPPLTEAIWMKGD